MNLRSSIKVYFSLFVALAENDALPFLKIDVISIQLDQLSHAHTGGGKQVDDGKIAGVFAMIPHDFQRFIRIGFFYGFASLDLMNPAHRTLQDQIFILQPGKEAGQDAADVVHCDFAGVVAALITVQISAQIVGSNVLWLLPNGQKHVANG